MSDNTISSDYISLENSCENEISRNYYMLNQELLKCKYDLSRIRKKKISKRNIRILGSYIKNGAFSRIKRRVNIALSHKQPEKRGYSLKSYAAYPSGRVAVYTCIWGKYDSIVEPLFINPDADYYIITDQKVPSSSKWKKYDIPKEKILNMSPVEINRYCKMLPHELFPQYDYSIYIDGNIRIITDIMPLIADLGDKVLGIHSYPVDCIYSMKDAIIAGKKAKKEDVEQQITIYRNNGFPEHFGAFECNILVRKHMSDECIQIMNAWWQEFNHTSSKRDQLSLPYVIWKSGKGSDYVASLGADVRLNPRFQLAVEHLK